MSVKRKTLFSILGILVLIFLCLLLWNKFKIWKKGEVRISTDKLEYSREESIKVRIENKLSKKICFSSCSPFFLERKNESWEKYPYERCKKTDFVENCVLPGKEKNFETEKIFAEPGIHRLAIPVCFSCKVGDFFFKEAEFYSNEFSIK